MTELCVANALATGEALFVHNPFEFGSGVVCKQTQTADIPPSTTEETELNFIQVSCNITVAVAEKFLLQMVKDDTSIKVGLLDIADWLHMLLTKAECTSGVVIVAYIYCQRLLEQNKLVNITTDNWKSLSLTAILLASKVWDDLSMVNGDFAYFTPFALQQINDWERSFLRGLHYNIQIDCGEYEKLFFEFRTGAIDNSILQKECERRYSSQSNRGRSSSKSSNSSIVSPTTSISTISMEVSPSAAIDS